MRRFAHALALILLLPGLAAAQSRVPGFSLRPPEPEPEPDIAVRETNVGILDPAPPLHMMRLRVDLNYDNRRPTRLTYLMGADGLAKPERRVDYQDVMAYGEYAPFPWFSTFAEVPYRWLNPDVNDNTSGFGDSNFGFKACTWTTDGFIASFLLRLYNPTSRDGALGSRHWSVEPGLLASWQVMDQLMLEGEFRYWVPLGGGELAGEFLRYGVGVSYGQRTDGFWIIPVAEGVGWTLLGGKTLVATPTDFFVQDVSDQTIVNGYLGVRWGLGQHFDSYVGYGRCFTGPAWQRDFLRVELRLLY